MNMVYLGFLSDPIGWMMENFLDPLFELVGNLLNTVFTWLFNTLLEPALRNAIIPLAKILGKLLWEMLAGVFYSIMASIWKLLDSMEKAYDIFIGISKVTDTMAQKPEATTLLEALYNIRTFRNAFYYVLAISFVMLFMFTIYSVSKSIFDLETEKPKTVSHVMTSFMRACVQFLIVPLLVLFMIRFSGVLVNSLNNALESSENTGTATVGSTLFVISSLDASKDSKMNISTAADDVKNTLGVSDSLRKEYYLNGPNNKEKVYSNTDQVKEDFVYSKFDFVVGLGCSVFIFIVMISNSMVFIQRLFDILLLYIVSPFFVSTMPLDDGERFKRWRELFLGKSFSGMGGIVAMKLYLMVVPVIMGGQIEFTSLKGDSAEVVYILKVLFLLGGAWAATKSGSMVTSLISAAAGSSESSTAQMGTMIGYGIVKKAGKLAWKATKKTAGGMFGSRGEAAAAEDGEGTEKGAAEGGAEGAESAVGGDDAAKLGTGTIPGLSGAPAPMGGIGAPMGGIGGIGGPLGLPGGDLGAAPPAGAFGGLGAPMAAGMAGAAGGAAGNSNRVSAPKAAAARAKALAGMSPEKRAMLANRRAANDLAATQKSQLPKQKTKKFLGMTLKTNRDGNYRPNINMGGFFSNTYGADGSHTVKFLGMQMRMDHNGQVNKMSAMGIGVTWDNTGQRHLDLSMGKLVSHHVGSDGSQSTSFGGGLYRRTYDADEQLVNSSTLGVEKQLNSTTGEMYTRHNSWLGIERVEDKEGNVHMKSCFGAHFAPDANGDYHFSHGWGAGQKMMINEEGKAECVGRTFIGMNVYEASSKKERLSKLDINKPKRKK